MKSQEKRIADLLDAAKQDDQHAYRELLDLHWNELYGFLIKRTENENDAEDLCLQAKNLLGKDRREICPFLWSLKSAALRRVNS